MVLVVKNTPVSAGDIRDEGSTLGLGRSPGEGNGNPLQYSCLENTMHREAYAMGYHPQHHKLDTTEPIYHACSNGCMLDSERKIPWSTRY